jgi:tetratricopeptide (TPR) repeat protein
MYGSTLDCCNKVLANDENNFNALYLASCALDKLGKHEEALECFGKILKINELNNTPQRSYKLYHLRSSYLIENERYEEAIECLQRIPDIDNNEMDDWINQGDKLYKLGKHEEALEWYHKVTGIDENYFKWFKIAIWSKKIGKYEEALECFEAAINLNAIRIRAWDSKSNILYSMGRREEANECLNKRHEIIKDNANVFQNKGNTLDELGKYQEALECYEGVIQINDLGDMIERREEIMKKLNQSK